MDELKENPTRDYSKETFEQFIDVYVKQIANDDDECEYVVSKDVAIDGWNYYSRQITSKGIDTLLACIIDMYCNFCTFYAKVPDSDKTVADAVKLDSMYNMVLSLGLEDQVSTQLEVYRRKNM